MKKIKFILLLCFSILSFAQSEGYKKIAKAGKFLKSNEKLDKAILILDDAKDDNYGFCGNSYAEAFWKIDFLKAQIYSKKKMYSNALKSIDEIKNCNLAGDCYKSDSLRLKILIDFHGLENLKKELKLTRNSKDFVNIKNDSISKKCLNLKNFNYQYCFGYLDRHEEENSKDEKSQHPLDFLINTKYFQELIGKLD